MTRKGYTEEQLIAALQPAEAGGRRVSYGGSSASAVAAFFALLFLRAE